MSKLNFIKTVVLFLFLATGYENLKAQDTFYQYFDGGANDVGSYVSGTSDGGFIITGKTTSFGNGDFDVWLIRTDASGNAMWKKSYGGMADDEGVCVQPAADGGFIVAANSVNPGHFNQGWIFKTNSEGNIDWEYKFGGNDPGDGASFVLPDGDGNYLVSGTIGMRSLVLKLDESGQLVWSQQYFSNNNSTTSSICVIHDTLYAVSGDFEFPAVNGSWYPDLFWIQSNGELVTQITWTDYPGGKTSFVSSCNDGGVLMGGQWNDDKPSLIRIGGQNNYAWEYSFPLSESEGAMMGSVQFDDNTFLTAGDWFSAAMIGINDSGEQLWSKYGRLNNDYIYFTGVQKIDDNHVIFTGYRNEEGYDHDVILVKATRDGSLTGFDNSQRKKSGTFMKSAPNPFSEQTTFTFTLPEAGIVNLTITDISGREIKTIASQNLPQGEHQFIWNGLNDNGEPCAAGTYFATLKLDSGFMQSVKVVKR